ncbi:response regulator transcription factor [Nonomuraea zeae]|uniref:Response regulator transcription factor n=1 Tax=Nonomuraea zeae TaxID=1642303 RepID=A0A5S4GVQ5_9ACTN|nr:response regulator transcription factor [Nonomuraea zeae]TMR36812.1 response regulator transcription factor [Nonomuraea zeae]
MADVIRVLLADGEHLIRAALAALLNLEEGIEVAAQVGSADELAPAVEGHRPDVAVIDIALPGMDVLAATRQIAGRCGIVILASLPRPGYLRGAMAAGVGGFLGKDTSAEELAAAIRKVAAGGRYLDTELAAAAMAASDSPLTEHERAALRLVRGGAALARIATELHLTEGIVRDHLRSAMAKLDAASSPEAIRNAQRLGWL